MALIEGLFPPSRENYELLLRCWQIGYPIVSLTSYCMTDENKESHANTRKQIGSMQWIIKWYGMGKTSVSSVFNLPGRFAWMTMECPGFLTLLYVMNTLPQKAGIDDLPWQNRVLGGLFV